jgi:DNA replication ATP-dependent helicase Dna2
MQQSKTLASISNVLDIEERVWSPMFGLKGNIDATIQLDLIEGNHSTTKKTILTPLEFKTGKRAMSSHEAQTSLYMLLLSDRYGEPSFSFSQFLQKSHPKRHTSSLWNIVLPHYWPNETTVKNTP